MFLFAPERKGEDDVQEPITERPIFFTEVMGNLVTNPARSDVIFVVPSESGKDVEVPAHRLILAAASPLFAAMFFPPKTEGKRQPVQLPIRIALKDTDEDTLKSFLQAVYTDTTIIDSSNVFGLLKLATKYCIEKLHTQCQAYLDKDVNAENVIDFYLAGPELKKPELGIAFIRKNAATIFDSSDFLRLPQDRLVSLLKDPSLTASEGRIFSGVSRWVLNQAEKSEFKGERKDLLRKLIDPFLPHISLGCMSVSEIAQYVEPAEVFSVDELYEIYQFSLSDEEEKKALEFPFKSLPRSTKTYVFQEFQDTNGLLYDLGRGDSKTYTNPIPSLVTCTISTGMGVSFPNLADRVFLTKSVRNTPGDPQPWLCFTFTTVLLRITDIVIFQERENFLVNWTLEGRKGSETWAPIKAYTGDTTMTQAIIKRGRYSVTCHQFYDSFRILLTGPSHTGTKEFDITQVEFYGATQQKLV